LEAAVFEIVRGPAIARFLARRSLAPSERGELLEQIKAVEVLQKENLIADAAPRSLAHGAAPRPNTS
jgi:hypothetical protein